VLIFIPSLITTILQAILIDMKQANVGSKKNQNKRDMGSRYMEKN